MSLMSQTKSYESLVWEERGRQWSIEKANMQTEIETLRDQLSKAQETSGSTRRGGNESGSVVRVSSCLSNASSTPGMEQKNTGDGFQRKTSMNRRVSRQSSGGVGNRRVLVCDSETMTDPLPEPKIVQNIIKQEIVKKTVTQDLYDAAIKEAEDLKKEVQRLNLIIKRQDLELRDSINANQKAFLLDHMDQLAEEQKLRFLQRALMSKGIPIKDQNLDSPTVKRIFRGTDVENPLEVAKRLERIADAKRNRMLGLTEEADEGDEGHDGCGGKTVSPSPAAPHGFTQLAADEAAQARLETEQAREALEADVKALVQEGDILGLKSSTCVWCTDEVPSPLLKGHQEECRRSTAIRARLAAAKKQHQ